MKILATALALISLVSTASAAQSSEKVDIFTVKDLEMLAKPSVPKGTPYADHNLAKYGNHYLLLVKREETGSSELHQHDADVFVVEEGEGTILTGGKIIKPRTTKPGEIRGSGIEGGERHALAKGDIVHIPAGTPHQLLLEKGKPFVYFVVKVSGQ